MRLQMTMIGHRVEQAKYMLAGPRVEAINQYSVRGAVIGREFKFRIVDHDIAIILDSKLGSYLQRNFRFTGIESHAGISSLN